MTRVPPPPSASAPLAIRRAYWQNRIKSNISDRKAYLQLGLLEERAGFFKTSLHYLESARALGLPDSQLSAPLGRVYAQLAMVDQAETELAKAIALYPQQWEPVANLAGLYMRNAHGAKATEVIREYTKRSDPRKLSTPELGRIGLALLEHNLNTTALHAAEEMLRRDPNSIEGLSVGARAAFALKDSKKSEQYIERVLKEIPNETTILYFYGLVLRQQGKYDQALAAWQKGQKLTPDAPDIYERIAEEYARRKDYKQAAAALEYLTQSDNSLPTVLKTADAYHMAGNHDIASYWDSVAAGLRGNFKLALEKAKIAAASANPNIKRRGQLAIAESYRGMTKKPEYLAAVLQATKTDTVDDYLLRARAYEFLPDYDKYIATQKEAIIKFPQQEAALRYSLAMVYSKIGERDKAISELKRSLELNPQNVEVIRKLANEYFRTRSVGDNLHQASDLARRLVAITHDESDDWFLLGQIYAAQNQLPQAIYCFEHTIDLEPGYGPVYLELGRAQARNGNSSASKEAMALYQKYVIAEQQLQTLEARVSRTDATDKDHIDYANMLLQMGNSTDALGEYEKAYIKNPKNKDVEAALHYIYKRLQLPDRVQELGSRGK